MNNSKLPYAQHGLPQVAGTPVSGFMPHCGLPAGQTLAAVDGQRSALRKALT
jgi:hypothetical protein